MRTTCRGEGCAIRRAPIKCSAIQEMEWIFMEFRTGRKGGKGHQGRARICRPPMGKFDDADKTSLHRIRIGGMGFPCMI
jgi:hypothetical protein